MVEKTCAACVRELEANSVAVTIGGKTVAVCCNERAQTLKEVHAAAAAPKKD